MHLVGARHCARLRGAIAGTNTSDVIDADVLTRAGQVSCTGDRPLSPHRPPTRPGCLRSHQLPIVRLLCDPGRHLRPGGESEFGQDVLHMPLCRAR
jgi:hypothetical protein